MKTNFIFLFGLLSLLFLSCATQQIILNEIQKPVESSRLRVFVQPLQSNYKWSTPYSVYVSSSLAKVEKVWHDTGIYEVVPYDEVDVVVGSSRKFLPWESGNYALSKRVASALWAEYAMLVERDVSAGRFYWKTTLINVRTGAVYKVSMHVPGGSRTNYQPVIRASYEQLFADGKEDMLATARLKRDAGVDGLSQPLPADETQAAHKEVSRNLNFSEVDKDWNTDTSPQVPIAVYDMDAQEKDELISRILSESLRSELISQGRFQLVSREALDKIMEELSLQLSGLIDENQAVSVGLGLAAEQIVVGFYGTVGTRSVIQVKRIDVETQETVGTGSLSCETGREEELLDAMPDLAKDLSDNR